MRKKQSRKSPPLEENGKPAAATLAPTSPPTSAELQALLILVRKAKATVIGRPRK